MSGALAACEFSPSLIWGLVVICVVSIFVVILEIFLSGALAACEFSSSLNGVWW